MSVPLEHPRALAPLLPADERPHADLPPAPAPDWPREIAGYVWRLLAVAAGLCAVVYGYQLLLSPPDAAGYPTALTPYFPTRYFEYGAVFLTAATLFPRRREWAMAVVALPCLHNLWDTCPALVPWIAVLVPTLYRLLGPADRPGPVATRRFWWGVAIGVFLGPKIVQVVFLHNAHDSFLDRHQTVFIGLFLRYAYYYYERRHGLVPAGRFWEHVAYLLFVPQITGTLNVPPGEMSARWGFGAATVRRGFEAVGWAALKIPPVLYLERRVLPSWGYARGYPALHTAPLGVLWVCLLTSYVYWALLVSAKFDLMIALFRFFGVNVEDNFRWPLLATSPVALWRRWNVYNRRLLLKCVYFPLGGNRTHVYRNILLTFLASAILLHTGFFGSPWWGVNPFQLRDWLLYFAGQGAVVCAAYWWLQRPFWERLPTGAVGPLRVLGWSLTLASSAWLHVLPLAAGEFLNTPNPPIEAFWPRLALMARALGWP